ESARRRECLRRARRWPSCDRDGRSPGGHGAVHRFLRRPATLNPLRAHDDMRRSALTAAVFAMVLGAFMQPTPATAAELPDFTRLVRTHGPSVVNISTLQRVRSARFPAASDDTPGDLRGLPFEETPESDGTSLGSGLIISSDGYILTCAHVVEDAREIVVRLFDRR